MENLKNHIHVTSSSFDFSPKSEITQTAKVSYDSLSTSTKMEPTNEQSRHCLRRCIRSRKQVIFKVVGAILFTLCILAVFIIKIYLMSAPPQAMCGMRPPHISYDLHKYKNRVLIYNLELKEKKWEVWHNSQTLQSWIEQLAKATPIHPKVEVYSRDCAVFGHDMTWWDIKLRAEGKVTIVVNGGITEISLFPNWSKEEMVEVGVDAAVDAIVTEKENHKSVAQRTV